VTGQPRKRRQWQKTPLPVTVVHVPEHIPTPLEVASAFVSDFWSRYWSPCEAGYHVVRYIAARRIQCMVRCSQSRTRTARRKAEIAQSIQDAQTAAAVARLAAQTRADAYRRACKIQAMAIVSASIRAYVGPYAAVQIQALWRGHRARGHTDKRLQILIEQTPDECKRARYERALAIFRAERARAARARLACVNRRKWARTEFEHSGWRPPGLDPTAAAYTESMLLKHVTSPPKQTYSGMRVNAVTLPIRSEFDQHLVTSPKTINSTWVGIPVANSPKKAKKARLGPPSRPGTITDPTMNAKWLKREHQKDEYVTQYNWLPAKIHSNCNLI
jgi:hypothetical protein